MSRVRIVSLIAAVTTAVALATPVSAAISTPDPISAAYESDNKSKEPRIASDAGVFETHGDWVHWSANYTELSAHGWWVNIEGPATEANVDVWLQRKKADGTWVTVGFDSRTVASGGGRGNRATARYACEAFRYTKTYRSIIDVDVIGYSDPSNVVITDERTMNCTP